MIAVAWKWVTGSGPDDEPDTRWAGVSLADEAALEMALRMASDGEEVMVVTAGPPDAAAGLRRALAAGADRAVRIELSPAVPSAVVAATIAPLVARSRLVLCGDQSADRGTGSVPAFLAAELDAAQALGLVELAVDADGRMVGVRRLDGGRRERLLITAPAVVSVEGAVARLRRAPLSAVLAAADRSIDVVAAPSAIDMGPAATVHPFRPRPRVLPPPEAGSALARVRELSAAGAASPAGETEVLDPPAAADRLLRALASWGYVP